jgi:acyl-CoA thioesterase-2
VTLRDPADELLDLFTLEELDANLYRAPNPTQSTEYRPTLYGGQVAAQALLAAAHTVPEGRQPHSIHGYFLRAGRFTRPTVMAVDRDRDGRSFSARHVNALQDGEVIFSALASFHEPEPGVEYEKAALRLDVDGPEMVPATRADEDRIGHDVMFDVRYLPPGDAAFPWVSSRMWVRPRTTLPDDPVMRACVLTYMSDMGWAFREVTTSDGRHIGGPSIDHAVWFQRLAPVGDWMLIDLEPLSVAGVRGVYSGTIHHCDGALAALIAQETLLRPVDFG